MSSRVIFHIDVNSAYLSWEAVYGISVRKDEVDLREVFARPVTGCMTSSQKLF